METKRIAALKRNVESLNRQVEQLMQLLWHFHGYDAVVAAENRIDLEDERDSLRDELRVVELELADLSTN